MHECEFAKHFGENSRWSGVRSAINDRSLKNFCWIVSNGTYGDSIDTQLNWYRWSDYNLDKGISIFDEKRKNKSNEERRKTAERYVTSMKRIGAFPNIWMPLMSGSVRLLYIQQFNSVRCCWWWTKMIENRVLLTRQTIVKGQISFDKWIGYERICSIWRIPFSVNRNRSASIVRDHVCNVMQALFY